jgi:hypothetical protein
MVHYIWYMNAYIIHMNIWYVNAYIIHMNIWYVNAYIIHMNIWYVNAYIIHMNIWYMNAYIIHTLMKECGEITHVERINVYYSHFYNECLFFSEKKKICGYRCISNIYIYIYIYI